MKVKWILILLHALIISTFFLEGFHYEGTNQTVIYVTGFEAIFINKFWIIGNIAIAYILLASVFQLSVLLLEMVTKGVIKGFEKHTIAVVNIQLLFGLIVVSLLGTFISFPPMFMVGFVAFSAYLKYKFNV